MAFLHNTSIKSISTNKHTQNNIFGTLPTFSRDYLADDFYSSPIINSINYPERSYLYTSKKERKFTKGSLTIEASIAVPIFILVSYALISIITVLYLQLSIQIALEETVRTTNKTAYISSLFLNQDKETQNAISEEEPSIVETIAISALSTSVFENAFINKDTKHLLNSSLIKNGENGIKFFSSSIDLKAGIADIIITYEVNLPFIPEKLFNLTLANRCYVHLYTGRELAKKQTATDTYVYYTTHGKVFHFNRYCQYLLDYTEAIHYSKNDPLLEGCRECVNITKEELETNNPIIYITKSRHCFHISLKCPAFTGSVFRTSYNSLKSSDKICETCLKGK